MLRIGLTGNLGSGKSTAAALFAQKGAHLLASDAIARDLQQPGQPVFNRIVAHFGPQVLTPEGLLDRPALALLAFTEGGADHLDALNAIIHPAVLARQATLAQAIFQKDPGAIVIVESALIFESKHIPVRDRFDRILLVTAPESEKIARFIRRIHPHPTPEEAAALEQDARRRLALQLPDAAKIPLADHILANDSTLAHLERQVDALWPTLQQAARTAKSLQ
jgi:dephospho-CoA kinase